MRCAFPGVSNAWTMPIKNRIDMLTTGVRTPVGIKIYGADLGQIERIGAQIERVLPQVAGTRSVFAERVGGGYFLDFDLKRDQLGALRPERGRCAGGGDERHRRRQRQHRHRRPRALPHQRALLPRLAQRSRPPGPCAGPGHGRQDADPAGRDRHAEAGLRARPCCATKTAC